jgi:hypothetical protein
VTGPTVPILIGGLFAWSIYRRVRRNIGRQKLRPRRILISLAIFAVIGCFLGMASLQNLNLLYGLAGGLVLGGALGFVGLRLTRFETTEEGHFYTPNAHIGVALSLLLAGRMIYRFMVLNSTLSAAEMNHPPPMQSPLTFFIVGLTFGYYIVYRIGLFVHTHDRQIPLAG